MYSQEGLICIRKWTPNQKSQGRFFIKGKKKPQLTDKCTLCLSKSTLSIHNICGLMKQNLSSSRWILSTVYDAKTAQLTKNKTSTPQWGMVEGASWSGLSSGSGPLAIIEREVNSKVFQNLTKDYVRVAICQVKPCRCHVIQQDNDPKLRSKSTIRWFQKKKIYVFEWPM